MTLLKRILKRKAPQIAGALVGALVVHLVARTTRWQVEKPESVRRLLGEGGPFIGVFWHGRLMMMPFVTRHRGRVHMLISEHRDGLLVSRLIGLLGIPTLAGSTRKGGVAALRAMQRLLDSGQSVAITPDGPRGPRMRAKIGAVKLAQWSGRPLLPVSFSTARGEILQSWDRFCFAWPFSRGTILWGEPIVVPREADARELERVRQQLEDCLNALTARADRLCGHEPVEPAPPRMAPQMTPVNDEFAEFGDRAAASGG